MKSMRVSKDIVPVGDLKSRAGRVLRRLKEGRRPIVITKGDKPAAVLVTPEEFDRLSERRDFLDGIREGLDDSDAGRLVDDEELGRELESRFGSAKRR